MLENQKKIILTGKKIVDIINPVNLSERIEVGIKDLLRDAQVQELIIPVVGAFSAGKTTLINSFLGKEWLPTGITPETSLATELRYSKEEYLEGIAKNGEVIKYSVENFDELKKDAEKFSFAKIYLNNFKLKSISPLVLVDMPGFDSPLDAHNKAILMYFSRGCHYIVLSSVEEGTVQIPLLRRLEEIHDTNRKFSFFLSKSNLKDQDSIHELLRHYSDVLSNRFDETIKINFVGNDGGKNLEIVLDKIDVENLFLELYQEKLKALGYDAIEAINDRIQSIKREDDENQQIMQDLQSSISEIKKKRDRLIQDLEGRYSNSVVEDLIITIGKDLNSATEELTSLAIIGNREEVSRRLSDIIRHSLVSGLSEKIGGVNQKIVNDYSVELKRLDETLTPSDGSTLFSENTALKLQDAFNIMKRDTLDILDNDVNDPKETKLNKIFKTVGGVVAILTNIAAPIVEVLILFIPEILTFLSKGSIERKKREAVSKQFTMNIFPDIKRKLRGEISTILNQQISEQIKQVGIQYDSVIKAKQEEIEKGIAEKREHKEDIKKRQEIFERTQDELKTVVNEVIEWN